MNEHDDVDGIDGELSPAMRGRRKVLASLVGGFAMPLLPHVPWAPNSGVVATHRPKQLAHGVRCDTPVIEFPINDPVNVLKAGLSFGLNLIPGVGSLIATIFDLLWPAFGGESIWDQIKDNVTKLVNDAIDEERERQLGDAVKGLKDVAAVHLSWVKHHRDVNSAESRAHLTASIVATCLFFVNARSAFQDKPQLSLHARCRILPMFVQLANLELVVRRDAAVHAIAYGFEKATADKHMREFLDALDYYEKHVDETLTKLFDGLRDEYQSHRGEYRADQSNGGGATGYSATGAWGWKKVENNARSLLTALVDDYRKLWPHMLPDSPDAPLLTRELWFGPYGVPDLRDIGAGAVSNLPDVVMPQPNPGAPIRHIGVPQVNNVKKRDKWRFPRNFEVYREGDGRPVLPNTWGFSTTTQDGGPVTGARVDTALYISRGGFKDCATGFLVSAMHFRQGKDRVRSVGSSDFKGQEIKGQGGEDVPVPDGHVLHEIHQCSTVRKLYENIGDHGAQSVGSVMFSFKLADPSLHAASRKLLEIFARTTPQPPAVNDLADLELRMENMNPASVAPSKRAGLRAQIEHEMETEHWEEDRAAFWHNIQAIADKKG